MKRHLFVPTKFDYARGVKPDVGCILCEIIEGRDTVERLEVHRTEKYVVSLNLHPYNPGHLLVFPRRHVCRLDELDREEILELHELQLLCMDVLGRRYGARGFNVGLNLGPDSGASIPHLHLHVVPRYERELGFLDIISGAKIMVEDPVVTCRELAALFGEFHARETTDGK